jgi:hypothetical protein
MFVNRSPGMEKRAAIHFDAWMAASKKLKPEIGF